jgi:hypothetical protein
MKQIHIKKNATLPKTGVGTNVVLKANSINLIDLVVKGVGLTYAHMPFDLSRVDDFENDFHIDYKLTKAAAAKGIILIGAYLEGRQIEVLLASILATNIFLAESFPLLELSFTERVCLVPIDPYVAPKELPAPVLRRDVKKKKAVSSRLR